MYSKRMMPKYRVWWNAGYGESEDIVEADDASEAEMIAYDMWLQEAESQANYGAEEADEEE